MSEKIIQNVQVNVDLKFNKDIAGLKGQVEKAVQSNLKAAGVNELLDSKTVILKSAVQGTARNLQTVERTSARLQNHLWDTEKNIIASNKSISELKGHFATVEGNIKNAVVGSDKWNDHYKQLDRIAIAIRNEEQNLLSLNKKQAGLIESRTRNENKRLDFSTKTLSQDQEGVRLGKARNENNQKIVKTSEEIRDLSSREVKIRNDYVSQVTHLSKLTELSTIYQGELNKALSTISTSSLSTLKANLTPTNVVNAWGSGKTQDQINRIILTNTTKMGAEDIKAHGKALKNSEIQGASTKWSRQTGFNKLFSQEQASARKDQASARKAENIQESNAKKQLLNEWLAAEKSHNKEKINAVKEQAKELSNAQIQGHSSAWSKEISFRKKYEKWEDAQKTSEKLKEAAQKALVGNPSSILRENNRLNKFEEQLSKLRTATAPFDLRQAGNIYTRQAARTSLMSPKSDKAVNFDRAAIQYRGNIEKTLLDPNTKISLNDFRVLTRRYNDLVYHHGGMINAGVKTILKEKEHSLKQLDLLDQRNKLVQQSAVTGFYDAQKIGHIEKQLGVGAYGASGAIPTQKYTYTSGKGLGVDENYQGAGKKLLQGITNQLDAGLVNINPGYAKKLVARQEELLLTRDIAMFKGQGNSTAVSRLMAQEKGAVTTRTTQANALTATRLSTGSEALIGTMGVVGIAAGTIAVTALGTAFTLAVVQANKFETALANLGGVSSYSEKQIKQFSQSARILSVNTTFGATETMRSLTELSKLGYTMEQAGTMVGAVQRSAALAGVSMESSANMIGEIVHQFGLTAASATGISDTMAAAFNSSALDFGKLEQSLKYAGPLAAIAGANFRETAAALGVMADQGINASMAGTSMRKFFTVINKEGSKSQKALKELGLETAPLELQMKALAKVFDTQSKVQKEFGIQASSGILAVFNKIGHEATDAANGIKTFSETFDAITKDNSGLALELMLKKTNTIAGQWGRMKTNLEELAISTASDSGIVGVFKELVSLSADLVGNLAKVSNLRADDKLIRDVEKRMRDGRNPNNPLLGYESREIFNHIKKYSIGEAIGKDHLNIEYINKQQKYADKAYALGEAKLPQLIGGVRESQTATGMSLLEGNTDFNSLKIASAKANDLAHTIYKNQLELNNLSKNKIKWDNEDILRNATLNEAVYENKKKLVDQEVLIMKQYNEYGFNMEDPKTENSLIRILYRGRGLRTESINPKTGFDPLETTQRQLDSHITTAKLSFQIGDLFKATRDRTIAAEKKKKGGDDKESGGGRTSGGLLTPPSLAIFYDKIKEDQVEKHSKIGSEQLKLTDSLRLLAEGGDKLASTDKVILANRQEMADRQAEYIKVMDKEAQAIAESIYNRAKGSITERQRSRLKEKVAGFSDMTEAQQKKGILSALGLSENLRGGGYHISKERRAEVMGSLSPVKGESKAKFTERQNKAVANDIARSTMAVKNIIEDNKNSMANKTEASNTYGKSTIKQTQLNKDKVLYDYATTTAPEVEKYNKENALVINQGKAAAYNPYRQISQKETIDITAIDDTFKLHQKNRDNALANTNDPELQEKITQDGLAEQTAMELEKNKVVMQAWQDRTNKTKEYFDIAAQGVNLLGESDNLRHQNRMANIDEALKKEVRGINHKQALGIISARAAQRLQASAEKKAEEDKAKSFERNKSFQRANAYMQGASGILSAVAGAMTLGPILGPIMGVINSGIVLASMTNQINAIDAQKYATGGFPSGRDARITVNERGQEAVLNATATARLGRSTINDLNAGKSASFGGNSNQNQTINITYAPVMSFGANTNEASLRRVASDERRIFAEKMKDVSRRGFL